MSVRSAGRVRVRWAIGALLLAACAPPDAHSRLFEPLGIRLRPWSTDPQGVYFGGMRCG